MATGGRGGRPKKADGDQATKHVRLFEDIAEWVGWIVRIEGGSSSQLLDPLVRAPILARYKKIEHLVEEIKGAERKAAEWAQKQSKKPPGS